MEASSANQQSEKLLLQAKDYFMASKINEAEACCKQVIEMLSSLISEQESSDQRDKTSSAHASIAHLAHAYNRLSTIADQRGEFNKMIEYSMTGIVYAQRIDDKQREGNLFGNIGTAHANMGDYALALEYWEKALVFAEASGNKQTIISWLINLSVLHQFMGDFVKALEIVSRAEAIAQELGDEYMLVTIFQKMAEVQSALQNFDMAEENLQKALAFYEKKNMKEELAIALTGLGLVEKEKGNSGAALRYLERALQLNEETQARALMANTLGNIGNLYIQLQNYSLALDYVQRALQLAKEIGDKRQEAYWLGAIGIALSKMGDEKTGESEEYLKKSLDLSKEIGLQEQEVNALRALSDVMKGQSKPEEALLYYKKFHAADKQLRNQESTRMAQQMENRRKVQDAERDRQVKLATFHEKEKILHSVLPPQIAERIVAGEKQIADYFPAVSILFADIEGFTPMSADMPAHMIVKFLNHVFSAFDHIMKKHGVEKIKTIGDGYMAIAGAPVACEDHAERITKAAIEMMHSISVPAEVEPYLPDDAKLAIRVGLHTGSVVAGVVGEDRFVYDVYSDAVNTAARMESHGESGKIHVSTDFMKHLMNRFTQNKMDNHGITFEKRGDIEVKGKGKMKTWFLMTAATKYPLT